MIMELYEIIKTYELDPIDLGDGEEELNFRIEILKYGADEKRFTARVYRRETYQMKPSFASLEKSIGSDCADHEIFVVDDTFNQESFSSDCEEMALAMVLSEIKKVFGLS